MLTVLRKIRRELVSGGKLRKYIFYAFGEIVLVVIGILIALQIAVTMAIMVNAISIMQERGRMMARPSGIDENKIFII